MRIGVVVILVAVLFLLVFLFRPSAQTNGATAAELTLMITNVRGYDHSVLELEGENKGEEVRFALIACDLLVDNQTGVDLVVLSNFHSALDYFTLELLRDGEVVTAVDYINHLSPTSPAAQPFVLRQGKTRTQLRFPVRLPPKDWTSLQARLVGVFPGSKFNAAVVSNTTEIQRVDQLDETRS